MASALLKALVLGGGTFLLVRKMTARAVVIDDVAGAQSGSLTSGSGGRVARATVQPGTQSTRISIADRFAAARSTSQTVNPTQVRSWQDFTRRPGEEKATQRIHLQAGPALAPQLHLVVSTGRILRSKERYLPGEFRYITIRDYEGTAAAKGTYERLWADALKAAEGKSWTAAFDEVSAALSARGLPKIERDFGAMTTGRTTSFEWKQVPGDRVTSLTDDSRRRWEACKTLTDEEHAVMSAAGLCPRR